MSFINQADDKPTVRKAMEAFGERFLVAARGSDMNGLYTGVMLRFLREENVPPYYEVKARIILAACREEDEPWENVNAANHHIKQAEEALKVAKDVYVHDPDDAQHMRFLERSIQEEKQALHEYQGGNDEEEESDDH